MASSMSLIDGMAQTSVSCGSGEAISLGFQAGILAMAWVALEEEALAAIICLGAPAGITCLGVLAGMAMELALELAFMRVGC